MNKLELTKREAQTVARQTPNVADMLQAVIQGGVTNENVGALEKLVGLYERMEAKRAEQQFAEAFAKLQSELPIITATSVIPNRGKYEKFEDIWRQVGATLNRNGFSVSFDQHADDKRITSTCTLRHVAGHSVPTKFGVRLGGRADSDTQADCKASTTAKRNALCYALNIVIQQDCMADEDDPRNEGGNVTEDQAFELERRVKELNVDVTAFLRFAGAATFATIPAGKYGILDTHLQRKERGGK